MAESILLIQKDNTEEARKDFIERFNQATGGDFRKLVVHECTAKKPPLYYWDFEQSDIEYKLEYHSEFESYALYEV